MTDATNENGCCYFGEVIKPGFTPVPGKPGCVSYVVINMQTGDERAEELCFERDCPDPVGFGFVGFQTIDCVYYGVLPNGNLQEIHKWADICEECCNGECIPLQLSMGTVGGPIDQPCDFELVSLSRG